VENSTIPPASNRLTDAPSFSCDAEHPASLSALQMLVGQDDLSVVFQPIIDLGTGKVYAHEALVRCHSTPPRSPPQLFEEAMVLDCVGRLGRLIREIAVPLCAGLPVFLNVHPDELSDRWLVRPDDPVWFHDAEIFLEVTESVPLSHFELCLGVLHELRSRGGVHLVVDDLGAGFSNLKSISDLEPKVVKLDRELIAGLDRRPRQQRLVAGVVRLCDDLEATVVAEGVETPEEYRALRDTGAQLGQGYLFARPAYPVPAVSWPPAAPPS
jgi:EAL domain-containing protein (putative c-di-GMP-specific phosphodiesterase class I)